MRDSDVKSLLRQYDMSLKELRSVVMRWNDYDKAIEDLDNWFLVKLDSFLED